MQTIDDVIDSVIEEYKERTAKRCYKVIKLKDEEPGIMDNKIGGTPYIPKGEEIPKDSNGEYMALLLQLNLKDVNLEGYPNEGILEIFSAAKIDVDMESKIMYFADNCEPELNLPNVSTDEFSC